MNGHYCWAMFVVDKSLPKDIGVLKDIVVQ
jgi:hypothetical protein